MDRASNASVRVSDYCESLESEWKRASSSDAVKSIH